MTTVSFDVPGSRLHTTVSHPGTFTGMAHETATDRRMSNTNEGMFVPTTLLLRKLPRNTTNEAVRTMLLFAKDLQDTELITSDVKEDTGFVTALAHFSSSAAASEAQAMLDGKPNTAGQAKMIVDIVSHSAIGSGRRNTMDPNLSRGMPQPISPPPSHTQKSSRFNGTFQSIDKLSPPLGPPSDQSQMEGNKTAQSMFSAPPSGYPGDRSRISGKSIIDEDAGEDETGDLLRESVAYINNDNSGFHAATRQSNSARLPMAAFNNLSLNTNMNGPTQTTFASPRSGVPSHASNGTFTSGTHPYQGSGNQFMRHNYPPVNPADQNPPCNTLYVGNLPMDTSEDELKAMFSKQRGYKRLCFRTKQNGPMCFVEFEDVSFATKALNELYGAQLHNSVKGGIRLSFSKNPLGVRSGQPGSANSSTPISPGASMMNGMPPMSPGSFSAANGPPPGLSVPPGLSMGSPMSPGLPNGQYLPQNYHGTSPLPGHRGMSLGNTGGTQHGGGNYHEYMLGR